MGGKFSRDKGHDFERFVANAYRLAWPSASVRRSLQAHNADEPDVVVEHATSMILNTLWTECQHAATPTPLAKLAQAERDCARMSTVGTQRLPVVVWKKTRGGKIQVTTRLWVLGITLNRVMLPIQNPSEQLIITLDFGEWLKLIKIT